MPNDSLHSHSEDPPKPPRRADDASNRRRPDSARLEQGERAALAGFELLADPRTIAGEAGPRDARDEEVERLRSALQQQSHEIETLRLGGASRAEGDRSDLDSGAAASEAPRDGTHAGSTEAVHTAASPRPRDRLLDSTEARRLAAEAQERQRASREALAAAQQALASEAPRARKAPPLHPAAAASASDSGWQRRALARPDPELRQRPLPSRELVPPEAPEPPSIEGAIPEPTTASARGGDDEAPHEAGTDLRVLRATLAIAHETALAQKDELTALREQLAESERELEATRRSAATASERSEASAAKAFEARHAELAHALEQSALEQARLRDRIAANDREAEAREADRELLRQTLDRREQELAERTEALDGLRDRCEAQERALESTRQELADERSRTTAMQAVFGELRATLADRPEERDEGTAEEAEPIRVEEHEPAPVPAAEGARPLELDQAAPTSGRPAIFDAWLDDQVRHHFGPMGIDRFVDLLRAPLERSAATRSGARELDIVLLGRGATGYASQLALGLVENGTPAFRIHVGDTTPESSERGQHETRGLVDESPVQAFLRPLPLAGGPEGLSERLATLRPAAIVLRDFLTHEADVRPWLDAVAEPMGPGDSLIFAEETGLGRPTPPAEMSAIGDRIWELMPARYTLGVAGESGPSSWSEAYAASAPPPVNQLLDVLRARFPLEIFAQFGFLAAPFVAERVGANFDPAAPRDRRFLRQIAELDERKIEAGIAPPLHWVGLCDPSVEA